MMSESQEHNCQEPEGKMINQSTEAALSPGCSHGVPAKKRRWEFVLFAESLALRLKR